jgi:hypothetical protein
MSSTGRDQLSRRIAAVPGRIGLEARVAFLSRLPGRGAAISAITGGNSTEMKADVAKWRGRCRRTRFRRALIATCRHDAFRTKMRRRCAAVS